MKLGLIATLLAFMLLPQLGCSKKESPSGSLSGGDVKIHDGVISGGKVECTGGICEGTSVTK